MAETDSQQYYKLDKILEQDAIYNIIVGERSNGKTYACLMYALEQWFKERKQFALIRRYAEAFKAGKGQAYFESIIFNGELRRLSEAYSTEHTYVGIRYKQYQYFMVYEDIVYDKKGNPSRKLFQEQEPIGYAYYLTNMENDKGTTHPAISTIIFDEFMTRNRYLPNEFVIFANMVSTIVRRRSDAKIFLCGNSVSFYCPYFEEMGLKHVKSQEQGTIAIYRHKANKIAVEYTASTSESKESDVYFAFDNPKLEMITSGAWELDVYPHLTSKIRPSDIVLSTVIRFNDDLLGFDVVKSEFGTPYGYIYWRSPNLSLSSSLLFSNVISDSDITNPLVVNNLINACHLNGCYRNVSIVAKLLYDLWINKRVFVSNNECGEVFRCYLDWCKIN